MKKIWFIFIVSLLMMSVWGCGPQNSAPDQVNFKFIESYNQILVLANGEQFTSYLFDTTLKKPVLYPVYSPSHIRMQREYPLKTVEGESHDHPHHVGIFFTYGSDNEVNGNSFWQGQEGKARIAHVKVTREEVKPGMAVLGTLSNWLDKSGKVLMVEDRTMVFSGTPTERSIDFTFKLTAQDENVVFKDTKEGMFAIRTAPWLKEKGGTGSYLSSEGDTTAGNIWGKRAKWVRLEGKYNGKAVGIIIMNHPNSVNYPTFWHARNYGLFAANPLGQSVFLQSRGEENAKPLNYEIPAGQTGVFKFKMIIYEGHITADQINKAYDDYVS